MSSGDDRHVTALDFNLPKSIRHVTQPTSPVFTPLSQTERLASKTLKPEDLLSRKWLTPQQLSTLTQTHGIFYVKGKFSHEEDRLLRIAIESYQTRNGLDRLQLERIIYRNREKRDDVFWTEIASTLPTRPLVSVYHHVRRAYQPRGKQGAWHPLEDGALLAAIDTHGRHWKNHLKHRHIIRRGVWTKAEEAALLRCVEEARNERGESHHGGGCIAWTDISKRMDYTRSRQQCSAKWLELQKLARNGVTRHRWCWEDTRALEARIHAMGVITDGEINWKSLQASFGNVWSIRSLRRRWRTLKLDIDSAANGNSR